MNLLHVSMHIKIKPRQFSLSFFLLVISGLLYAKDTAKVITQESFSLIGEPAYPEDFKHFIYVNPDAPKGGVLRLAAIGTYDTLNPYSAIGRPPEGIYMIHDRLMTRSVDEPVTLYPVIAKNIQYPSDLQWVAFDLNPQARFHDDKPVTAEDVVFTFNLLKTSGSAFIKNNYRDVLSAKADGAHRVIFQLGAGRGIRLLAFIAFMPVMAKHFWQGRSFDAGLTQLPVGSGPMKISKIKLGRSIVYERVKNYWGADLPTHKGLYNFDTVKIDYYRDNHASIEAFRAGLYDFRYEFDVKAWRQNYNFSAAKKAQVIKETAPFIHPPGMKAFVFNTRKALFKDRQVRMALLELFDFEWINKHFLYSEYQRTTSFFENTPLKAQGLPSPEELNILEPFRKVLPAELFTHAPILPVSNGSGNNRNSKHAAIQRLEHVGWVLRNGVMTNKDTGKPFVFSLLVDSAAEERIVAPFKKNLADIGIKMIIKVLDISQYRKRIKNFDFDIASWHFFHSPFPGAEQVNNWSSLAANKLTSNNVAGVNNPAVDELVERIKQATHYDDVVHLTKALDRVLLWGCYVIPKWHINIINMAYWSHLRRPKAGHPYYPVLEAMWHAD
ncbi:MAG: extracellular solute-binding protein [Endozoicomonas sp. (ex Botrylloides leachii)]|nr:extracellular solute-binding protein [Endozoicomonas sp. (ex Botrylloides leachii)]